MSKASRKWKATLKQANNNPKIEGVTKRKELSKKFYMACMRYKQYHVV